MVTEQTLERGAECSNDQQLLCQLHARGKRAQGRSPGSRRDHAWASDASSAASCPFDSCMHCRAP